MANAAKISEKIVEASKDIEKVLLYKLLDEVTFTGKITIEINCNCGGITNVDMYTMRKIVSNLKTNGGNIT